MRKFESALLLQEKRNNLVELEYYGFILHIKNNELISEIGESNNHPFFHRSCAKPFQASLIQDFETDKFYDLTEEEIAVCCGSHTGENIHVNLLKNLLNKGGLTEKDLQCPIIAPLNNFDNTEVFSPLHNNCSGKHTLMLLLCRQNNWNINNYLDSEHPLQKEIYQKIKLLCGVKDEMFRTLDGCMAPVWASSLFELGFGFVNLMQTHPQIKNSMMNHPYLTGGLNRLDTHIMQTAPYTVSKVGAGGLCVIVNTEKNESLVIKIIDADMKARTIIALEALKQLNWINIDSINTNLLNDYFDSFVYTETGFKIGEYTPCFNLKNFRFNQMS